MNYILCCHGVSFPCLGRGDRADRRGGGPAAGTGHGCQRGSQGAEPHARHAGEQDRGRAGARDQRERETESDSGQGERLLLCSGV